MKAQNAITAKSAFRSIDGPHSIADEIPAARYGDAVICAYGAAGIEGTAKPFRSERCERRNEAGRRNPEKPGFCGAGAKSRHEDI